MSWKVLVTDRARRDVRRFPRHDLERIEKAVEALADGPFVGDVRKLGPGSYRKRVGEYRVLYDVDFTEQIISVTSVRRRTTTTYR